MPDGPTSWFVFLVFGYTHIYITLTVASVFQEPIQPGLILPDTGTKAPQLGKLNLSKILEGSVFGVYTNASLIQCGLECMLRSKYLSLNYHSRKQMCELNGKTAAMTPDRFVHKSGYLYSDKATWGSVRKSSLVVTSHYPPQACQRLRIICVTNRKYILVRAIRRCIHTQSVQR
jgi:hypothetical protein